MSLPVLVLGAGGHAKVLIESLRKSGIEVLGATDANTALHGTSVLGVPVVGGDERLAGYRPGEIEVVNGLGSTGPAPARMKLFEEVRRRGYRFATVVHPSAIVASDVVLSEGAQIMAGAVIQPGCTLGRNAIINTRAAIDHDCSIGAHVHIAPGATLSGAVVVGEGTHVGTGASVVQQIRIGRECLVAAGAVVVADVRDGSKVAGVPAKETIR